MERQIHGTAPAEPVGARTASGFAVFTSNPFVAIALLSVAYAGSSFASAAIFSLPIDIAPGKGSVSSLYSIPRC
jgi:hypothetical protein